MRYLIVIHKDPDSDYGVTVPDLPGCFSAGSTIPEALQNAQEAIECHIEGMLADGEYLPDPADEEKHLANSDYRGGIFVFVDVDERKLSGKVQRINLTVPEFALARIDAYSEAHGETRSAFMTRAALQVVSGEETASRERAATGGGNVPQRKRGKKRVTKVAAKKAPAGYGRKKRA